MSGHPASLVLPDGESKRRCQEQYKLIPQQGRQFQGNYSFLPSKRYLRSPQILFLENLSRGILHQKSWFHLLKFGKFWKNKKNLTIQYRDFIVSRKKAFRSLPVELPKIGKTGCSHPNLEMFISGQIRDSFGSVGSIGLVVVWYFVLILQKSVWMKTRCKKPSLEEEQQGGEYLDPRDLHRWWGYNKFFHIFWHLQARQFPSHWRQMWHLFHNLWCCWKYLIEKVAFYFSCKYASLHRIKKSKTIKKAVSDQSTGVNWACGSNSILANISGY